VENYWFYNNRSRKHNQWWQFYRWLLCNHSFSGSF